MILSLSCWVLLHLESDSTLNSRFKEKSIQGFVSKSNLPGGEHDSGHGWLHPFYSGMWWQSIDSMLKTDYNKVTYLEEVSFLPFEDNQHVPLMPIDWMDFSVEHLSHYVKHFSSGDRQVQNRVGEMLEKYIRRVKEQGLFEEDEVYAFINQSAVSQTVVILPLRVGSYLPTTTYNPSDSSNNQSYMRRLVILQAGATIASLWRVGFPRIVVAGISENERFVAEEIFALLEEHVALHPMELVYLHMNGTEDEAKNVPKMAMIQFKEEVLKQRSGSTTPSLHVKTTWLGNDPSWWKNVYFSEPDLLLITRKNAISSLSEQIENGFILSAHRLQPIPHMLQFSDIFDTAVKSNNTKLVDYMKGALVPNHGSFEHVHSLESLTSFCCDGGNFYPSNPTSRTQPINTYADGCLVWSFCGFGEEKGNILFQHHKLLAPYTFLSMSEGTGISLVHQRQRICSPQKESCDDVF